MRSKVQGMRVPPELCFYFISVPRVLITKSAKLKDAGAERLVAAAAGKSLCIFFIFFDVELHRAASIWHSSGGQHDAFWRDPLDHFSSERRSWRPPWYFALISRQVSYSEGFTQACIQPPLLVYTKQHQTPKEQLLRERDDTGVACVCMMFFWGGVFAICARSWPCDAIVMRGSGIFHLSLAAWLAANGLCLTWFNPPSLQSAITYEMTTVSHPVSHLPWFHTSQQPNHSCEINERRWGVVGDSLITPAHAVM